MRKLPHNLLLSVSVVLVLLLGTALVGELALRFRRFSAPPTGGAAVQYLGPTNIVNSALSWGIFSISNGTPQPFFYYAVGVDYRSPTGWVSATWPRTPGVPLVAIDYKTSNGIVATSNSATFWAGIPTSNIPWRLHLCYQQAGLIGSLETCFYKLNAHHRASAATTTAWSGRPQLLVTDEVKP